MEKKEFKIENGILTKYDESAAQPTVEYDAKSKNHLSRVVFLPSNVNIIGKHAFAKNSNINKVVLNKGLEYIDDGAFHLCEHLTSVEFPQSLTGIGRYSFYDCRLEEISLGKKVKSIEENAFAENNRLSRVSLSRGIEKIGSFAFFNCGNLEEIDLPDTIREIGISAFSNTNLTSIKLPKLERIEDFAFEKTKLEQVCLPNSVVSIGNFAFSHTTIHYVVLPEGLKYIDNNAFENCQELSEIAIPDSLVRLGRAAFKDCTKLNFISMPVILDEIKSQTFENCKNLSSINFPYTLRKIENSAFEGAGIEQIQMHEGVVEIGKKAFKSCVRLSDAVLPQSIIKLGEEAFKDCDSLERLHLPENLVILEKGVLQNCSALESVLIPKKVEVISEDAFSYCLSLKNIFLSDCLKRIEARAFSGCENLEEVILPDGLNYIGDNAFEECSKLKSIVIPDSVGFVGKEAFKCCNNLESIVLPKHLNVIVDEIFLNCPKLKNIVFPTDFKLIGFNSFNGTAIESVDVSQAEVVEESAFCNCEKLKEAQLPEYLPAIKAHMFENCKSLKNITLPKKVTRIDKMAFSCCESLEEIEIPSTVESIENGAFKSCISLTKLKLPKSIKTIGVEAFENCNGIKKVILPKSIEFVGENAFKRCNNLKEITFNGGTLNECLFNIGDSIEVIKISQDCKINARRVYPMSYITKIDDYFYLTKEPISEESFSLDELGETLSIGVITSQWKDRKQIMREINGKNGENILNLYNYLFQELSLENFNEFFNSRQLKYFNQYENNYSFNDPLYYKLFYNLGGFRKPEIETRINKHGNMVEKQVDYAQMVKEIFNEVFFKSQFITNNIKFICEPMHLEGFKREFSKFIINRENLIEMLKEEKNRFGFIAKCYNHFENVQKTNTSNKGSQRQLKPTVEKFKEYFRENAFSGITDETREIAETIAPFTANQDTFEDAVAIEKERVARGTPTRILKEELKEEDAFKMIKEYSKRIKQLRADSLKSLTALAGKRFSFEWLEKNDPYNFLLGKLTSSCAHLEGSGYGIMRASIIHPDVQNLVIKTKNDEIVAKATLYVNREQGYGVVNTIEANVNLTEEEKHVVYKKIKLGVSTFAEKYNKEFPQKPLKIINVGIHLNRLDSEIKGKEEVSPVILNSINYQDFGGRNNDYNGDSMYGQYTIWQDEK